MHGPLSEGKFSVENLPETPRMMGDADVALIDQFLARLPKGARMIEFGPWLGGISQRLAKHGELHVVDRFVWSELNAKNYPDVMTIGDSFRSVFEQRLADQSLKVHVHESEIDAFRWTGESVEFCLVDAPRSAADLWACFASISANLTPSAFVLVKHGLNPAHLEMVALIDLLIAKGVFECVETGQPAWCNVAALRYVGEDNAWFETPFSDEMLSDPLGLEVLNTDAGREAMILRMGRLAQIAALGHFDLALKCLQQHPISARALAEWDLIEPQVIVPPEHEGGFAAVAELVSFHHGARTKSVWAPADENVIWGLRHAWARLIAGEGDAISIENMLSKDSKA